MLFTKKGENDSQDFLLEAIAVSFLGTTFLLIHLITSPSVEDVSRTAE